MNKRRIIKWSAIGLPLIVLSILIIGGLDINSHRPVISDLTIPVIKLDNENRQNMSRQNWRESNLTVIDSNGVYEFDQEPIQARGRGNSTWNTPPIAKRPYRFRFPSNNEQGVLGLDPARDFVLLANAYDNSHLRNYIGYTLARKLKPDTFQPSSVHVALFVNNDFRGIYLLTEQMQVHENRVNIDLERGDWYLELDHRANDNEIYQVGYIRSYFGRVNYPIDLTRTPDYETRKQVQRDDLMELLSNFNESILRKDNSFHQYINKDSFINYFIIQEFMQNLDISGNAHFQVVDGIIHMGPTWDLDNSSHNMRQGIRRYTRPWQRGYQRMIAYERQGWFRYLMHNSEFASAFYERWIEISQNELYDLLNRQDELIEKLLPMIYHEDLRWRHAWRNIFDLPHRRGMYRHFNFERNRLIRNSDFETYVNSLFTFFERRAEFLTEYLGHFVNN